MLNDLSDMVGVWVGLGGGEDASGCGGVLQAVQIQPLESLDARGDHMEEAYSRASIMTAL